MAYRGRNLNQQATYWGNPVPTGKGWYSFDDPILINVRWEDKQKEFVDGNGVTRISNAVVYCAQDMSINGFLALGDYTDSLYIDPADASTAFKISAFSKSPNIRGNIFLGMCYLTKER